MSPAGGWKFIRELSRRRKPRKNEIVDIISEYGPGRYQVREINKGKMGRSIFNFTVQ